MSLQLHSVGAITYDVWFSYIDRGSRPPRFQAYRHARWEKLDDWGRLTCEDVDKTTTQGRARFCFEKGLEDDSRRKVSTRKTQFSFP